MCRLTDYKHANMSLDSNEKLCAMDGEPLHNATLYMRFVNLVYLTIIHSNIPHGIWSSLFEMKWKETISWLRLNIIDLTVCRLSHKLDSWDKIWIMKWTNREISKWKGSYSIPYAMHLVSWFYVYTALCSLCFLYQCHGFDYYIKKINKNLTCLFLGQ